jgi:NADH-quinone oxidoreductase subunit I
MDHDYELASYDRQTSHIYNKEKLSKPAEYYAMVRPVNNQLEEVVRAEKAAKKAEREAAKAAKAAQKDVGGESVNGS